MLQTYQTKVKNEIVVRNEDGTSSSLYDYFSVFGAFFGHVERRLFVALYVHNASLTSTKSKFISKYQITARQFNSIQMHLKGKVKATKESLEYAIEITELKIKEVQQSIEKKEQQKTKVHKKLILLSMKEVQFEKTVKKYRNIKHFIHQKKRKLRNLEHKLANYIKRKERNVPSLCFGSRKLFHKQFHLEDNGWKSHAEWKRDWDHARSSQFTVVGSKDETYGNQSCTYDKENNLRLRVAYQFEKEYGEYLTLENVMFPYGQKELDEAREIYIGETSGGNPKKYVKSSISYRFVRKDKGWYILATTEKEIPSTATSKLGGVIAVDLNAGFLSVVDIDRFGNPLKEGFIPVRMYNVSQEQAKASLGDAIKQVVEYARDKGKHIVYEKLSFAKKKASLGEQSKKYGRMLSGFAYTAFKDILLAKAKKEGIGTWHVNPAYTSQIGHMKFMKRYGFSSHGSAALVIGRRGLGLKIEKPKGFTVLPLPKTWNKNKKRYSQWASITKSIKKQLSFNEKIQLLQADFI